MAAVRFMRLSHRASARSVVRMTTPRPDVTLLGLGRMGAAMAARLHEHDWQVTAWNRTPTDMPAGVTRADDVAAAVTGADLVLLCLFDAAACEEVIGQGAEQLGPETLVVNTSTVGPDEATRLAERVEETGARYVHAPVLGSVPTVQAGKLLVLAGGDPGDVDRARGVLDVLAREVRHVGDPARAAALKLVANASLAGALVALRDVVEAAGALGLDLDATLDVLAAGQLGGLSEAKRDRLTGEPRDADFAIGALLKDMTLLSDATGLDLHVRREIAALVADGRVSTSDDIAATFLPVP